MLYIRHILDKQPILSADALSRILATVHFNMDEIAESRGLKVTFFAGENLSVLIGDKIASVRGYIQGDEVFIRADHPDYTSDQLMRHEICHDMIDRGEIDPNEVKKRIEDIYGAENVKFIADRYAEAYEGSGLTPEEIWVEIVCDSYGDMNAFAPVEVLGSINSEFLAKLKGEVKESAKEARGPPEGEPKGHASYAGESAETADKMSLANAKEMLADGVDSEIIRKETGWFKGYDSKWRFEIDDSKIKIAFNGKYSRNPEIRRYNELVEKVYFANTATKEEQAELRLLDEKIGNRTITPDSLGDLIDAPELFAAYPELQDLGINFTDNTDGVASYHPGLKEITMPKSLKRDARYAKKTLLHEIQHAIQDIEGFAAGGSLDSNRAAIEEVMDIMELTEDQKKIATISTLSNYSKVVKRPVYDRLLQVSNRNGYQSVREYIESLNGYSYYKRIAGEVEARDVANRAELTADQRINTRPDIDRESVVFADGGRTNAEIITLDNGKQYVRASERQVISGDDTTQWAQQVADFINKELRNWEDFEILTAEGDVLTLTRDTAYKAGTRNDIKNPDGTYRAMTDTEYLTKLNAEIHINELAEVSKKNNQSPVPDKKNHRFAKDGFTYRTAYFQDYNGEYYKVTISIGNTEDIATIYNVGKIKKDSLPNGNIKTILSGSKPSSSSSLFIVSQKSKMSTDFGEKNSGGVGKSSQDLEFFDFLSENAEGPTAAVVQHEMSNREILANALESVASSESDKRELRKYKSRVKALDSMGAELSEVNAKIRELSFAPGPRDKITLNELKKKKTEIESAIQKKDQSLIMLEATAPLQSVLERAKKQAVAKAKEEARVKMDAQKERAREALDKQAKRYQESRKKGVEGRNKTAMKHKIQRVVSELDKLLRKGNKERNVKLGLQDAVAAALEAFDINAEKVARYERDMANLDQKIAEATDPIEIEALQALRDKKQRNSELLADKLLVMKKAYEDIHNNAGDVNYPAHYRAEAKVIGDRISSVLEKVGNVPISEMSLEQLESVYDMYRMVLTTVRDANKAFINGKLEDLSENAADMTAELQKIKKLPEERLRAGDDARAFVWNELTPYYAFKRIGSKTLMRYYDELVRGQDVYARDLDEAKSFAEDLRKKHGSKKWNRNEVKIFKDRDGRDFRLNLGQMMSIYAYSKREQAFDHMEKGGFFFNNKETFRTDKTGILKFVASNESGYKIDAAIFAKIKAALTSEQIAYVDEMQAYLTAMGEKGNEVSRQMWGIDIFKEKAYFPLKSKEDFIYQANTPAETSSLKNDGMTKETKPHASNPIVLESFDEVWANHVNKMSMYHGFVIPIDNLNKLINYGSWMEGNAQASNGIGIDMSESERYEILKGKSIRPQKIEVNPNFNIDFEYLEKNIKSEIEKPLIKKLRELGYLKRYKTDAIEVDFEFTGGGLRKSLNSQATAYGGSFADLAKVVLNLQKLLDNSVLVEIHSDKGAGTDLENKQLVQTFVMMSAFAEGNSIVPVQFEVKQFVDNANRLYLAVALTKIETGVVGNTTLDKNQASTYLLPVSSISIADLFAKINIKDENFFKYIPDGFLSADQIDAKNRALAKDEAKYGKKTRDTADRINGLERPKPNEGYALTNGISDNSIPQESENVNRNFSTNSEMGSHSISTMLEARFGPGVNEYLNTFIKDLNGAKAQSGGIMGGVFNLLSKFKKTSVAASLSVVVQQPTAILRALSEIDGRYQTIFMILILTQNECTIVSF